MYWIRGNMLDVLPWLGLFLAWSLGGYWLAHSVFDLDEHEQPVIGAGLGLVLYLALVNLLGRWLPSGAAFAWPALGLFALGGGLAWRKSRYRSLRILLRAWRHWIALAFLTFIFLQVGRGLGIFDEHKNLSLISTMALGNIPARNYLNPSQYLMYHYGFQLLGASMMRWGNFFPWSAFDLSKALVWAYGVLLAWLLVGRHLSHGLERILAVGSFVFATGTRYLLLLLPSGVLQSWDTRVHLAGATSEVAATFSQALTSAWNVSGGPSFPFPTAFLNGISAPYVLFHAGPSTLSLVIFLLLWLLAQRPVSRWGCAALTLTIACWALAWETSYGLFMVGIGAATLWYLWQKPSWTHFTPFASAAFASIPLVLWQGGTLPVFLSRILHPVSVSASAGAASRASAFLVRWPPAIRSAHFAPLSLTSAPTLIVALAELGPLVFFIPFLLQWGWRQFRKGAWYYAVLETGALFGFIFPMLFSYSSDRDISRLTAYAWRVWLLLLLFALWEWRSVWQRAAFASLGLMMFGGLVLSGPLLITMQSPVIANQIGGLDARIARDVWGNLPQEAGVFDPGFWRATTVTGVFTHAGTWVGRPFPQWEQLRDTPTMEQFQNAHYRYVYVDETWWEVLPSAAQEVLTSPCVQVLSEAWDDSGHHFRKLLDLSACFASP